ncbi:hypothetical protein LguiA_003599 [Lonicera macranthoides]
MSIVFFTSLVRDRVDRFSERGNSPLLPLTSSWDFESPAYSNLDNLTNKLESDEKEKIDTAFKEALERLDDNQNAKKEDYEEKLKEVETVEELRKILVKSSKLSIEDSC